MFIVSSSSECANGTKLTVRQIGIGRTARIGNKGHSTSFYNAGNDELAEDLVKLLVECEQKVPDFLAHLVPEGKLSFDDDTDEEGDGGSDSNAAAGHEDTSGGVNMGDNGATDAAW